MTQPRRHRSSARIQLLFTCEHGGNRIPAKYWPLFKNHRAQLESHRGYDAGALAIARDFSKAFGAELVYSTISRLLVELNRSRTHRQLFSAITRSLPREERQRVLERYYYPYREWVETQVRQVVDKGERMLHISCHSFTPALDGVVRRADVGLLYDPGRPAEVDFCLQWQAEIRRVHPGLVARRNYPYRGYSDGLTSYLRRRYPDPLYCAVELEVNQKYPLHHRPEWESLRKGLVAALKRALDLWI